MQFLAHIPGELYFRCQIFHALTVIIISHFYLTDCTIIASFIVVVIYIFFVCFYFFLFCSHNYLILSGIFLDFACFFFSFKFLFGCIDFNFKYKNLFNNLILLNFIEHINSIAMTCEWNWLTRVRVSALDHTCHMSKCYTTADFRRIL